MTRRNILILSLIAVALALLIFLLKPCASAEPGQANEGGLIPALKEKLRKKPAAKETAPAESAVTEKAPTATATPAELDTAPPVKLSGSDEIPNVAKCVSANFPAEAKPYVKTATVNVRLVVDKYGNVRSVKTTSVEFPEEPAEDLLPMLRKIFIQAGNRAFGSKKCPPHVVNGQNVGYAIEVPLQYKH